MESTNIPENKIIECNGPTKDWYAWNNMMPPKPDSFHVKGMVETPNPGVEAYLHYREPQGINPEIILLDLILIQKPGVWPRVVTWKEVSYYQMLSGVIYSEVNIFCKDTIIQTLDVDIIQ